MVDSLADLILTFNHMVERDADQLDLIFHALADATRRHILQQLAAKECTVSELAEPYEISLAAVSKHLKVLEKAGLLTRAVDGRVHRCAMGVKPLKMASAALTSIKKSQNKKKGN